MKIDNSLKGVAAVRTRVTRGDKGKTAADTDAAIADSVELTLASTTLNAMEEALAGMPVEDTDKVEAVRRAITDGHFQVNEEAVADALVQSTVEQLRRQGQP